MQVRVVPWNGFMPGRSLCTPRRRPCLAAGPAGIPGFYPVDAGIALQFRNGHLTGWKKDWQLRRPWPF